MIDWQDISTAPKDGTIVDLWSFSKAHERWERRANCYWSEMTDWPGRDHYGWAGLHNLYSDFQPPTHWMRLPAPPPPVPNV